MMKLLERLMTRRAAATVLIATVLLAVAAGFYTASNLGVNTDPTDLLSPNLPFRQAQTRYQEQFPQNVRTIVAVVTTPSPERSRRLARALAERLEDRPELFRDVYLPTADPFLEQQGLLFRSPEQLEELGAQLRRARPLLANLVRDPSLASLFGALQLSVALPTPGARPAGPLMSAIAEVVDAQLVGADDELSWQRLFGSNPKMAPTAQLVIVEPALAYNRVLAGGEAMDTLRAIGREVGLSRTGVDRLQLTGKVALSYEELSSVMTSMNIAGPVSMLLVTVLLYGALRSWRLVGVTLVSLVIGVVLTAGFATLAVGHLNLISVAFAVLYIGLGVDFAIHVVMRYRTLLRRGVDRTKALVQTIRQTRGPLMLCAITTAIGFYAFWPTSFAGVSELGIIAGTGMFISLAVSLLTLPAMIRMLPPKKEDARFREPPRFYTALVEIPLTHRRIVLVAATLVLLGCGAMLPLVKFNADPLSLRDPDSEALQVLRSLETGGEPLDWRLTAMAEGPDQARQLAADLAAVPGIRTTRTVLDFIPPGQDEKRQRIAELRENLGPALSPTGEAPRPRTPQETRGVVQTLYNTLTAEVQRRAVLPDEPTAQLQQALGRFLTHLDALSPDEQAASLRELERRLTGNLPDTLASLQRSLVPTGITEATLPEQLRRHWVSDDGLYRIDATLSVTADQPDALERVIDRATAITPTVTGSPLMQLRAGEAVVRAFQTAIGLAFAGIVIVLLIQLRHVGWALAVLAPLFLAAAITGAIMVLADIPFNFANVIALPLLLGIGVDNGIHLVHRGHVDMPGHGNLLHTTTTRAIAVSNLTTLCSFGALSLSPHPGTATMGYVLTIGLALMLVCTLLLLPAMLRPETEEEAVADLPEELR